MVNMKCELCGSIWTKDDSYRGMEIKCPNCQGACKCMISDEEKQECFECSVCGLICPPGSVKCPACGGEVVKQVNADVKNPYSDGSEDSTNSFWENFFWGVIFPWPTLILGLFSIFNLGIRNKRSMSIGFICGAACWIVFGIVLCVVCNTR